MNPISTTLSRLGVNIPENPTFGVDQPLGDPFSMWPEDRFPWPSQGENNADFLGAAGGLMYGNVFDMT